MIAILFKLKCIYKAIASHIIRYDKLDIEGLNQEQLNWLLDCIAPYAVILNLSGYSELTDYLLWSRRFPRLESLEMRACPKLSLFCGKRSQLPKLKKLDISSSPKVQNIDYGSGLVLSYLNISNCFNWNDFTFFIDFITDWINAIGCRPNIVKGTQRLARIRPKLSILT